MKRTCCFALAALVLAMLVAVPSAQAQTKKVSYAITDLGVLTSISAYIYAPQVSVTQWKRTTCG